MSITFTEMEEVPWPQPDNPVLQIAPDAYHWDDDAISGVLQQMTSHGVSAEGARLHQLAGDPPAKIIIDFLVTSPISYAAYAAAVVASAQKFIEKLRDKKHEPSDRTTIELEFSVGVHRARIKSNDAESAAKITRDVTWAMKELGLSNTDPAGASEEDGADDDTGTQK